MNTKKPTPAPVTRPATDFLADLAKVVSRAYSAPVTKEENQMSETLEGMIAKMDQQILDSIEWPDDPKWQWAAMDANSKWFRYTHKPQKEDHFWCGDGICQRFNHPPVSDWTKSKVRRPPVFENDAQFTPPKESKMSEWITDRLPDEHGPYVWKCCLDGKSYLVDPKTIHKSTPWMHATPPEPYVKPKPERRSGTVGQTWSTMTADSHCYTDMLINEGESIQAQEVLPTDIDQDVVAEVRESIMAVVKGFDNDTVLPLDRLHAWVEKLTTGNEKE